jgi:tetratricopeptide (TPR) repeat protein
MLPGSLPVAFFPYFYALMRIRHLLAVLLLLIARCGVCQAQSDASGLYDRARSFMRSGDYANAILVLNQAIQLAPENAEYRKQLAFSYYLNGDLKEALKVIREVIGSAAVDVQCYQIAGNIYKAQKDPHAAERNYERGLKKFPKSGDLYNELGEVYADERKYEEALQAWTTGIRVDPGEASDYYNAARTYSYTKDKVWTILYGEIFILLERYTARTTEMKSILLAAYKDLFNRLGAQEGVSQASAKGDRRQDADSRPEFRQSFLKALSGGSSIVLTHGVTPQTLVMLRTRFVLDWTNFYRFIYPFALFSYQQQLLKAGLFEAYNEWVFGPADNPSDYKAWVEKHAGEMHRLIDFLNSHPLQPVEGQFYQTGKITFEPATVPQS